MRLDKPFRLSEQSVRNIAAALQAEYSNIDFIVKTSKSSSSIYVTMKVNDAYLTTRIADHMGKSSGEVHKNILIGKSTKTKKVYNSLQHSARDVVNFSFKKTLNAVSSKNN